MNKIAYLALLLIMTLLTACGGGGGNGPAAVSKATLKLITSGTGPTIGAVDVTVNLPEGVTIKSASPPQVDDGVVTPSGVAATGTIAAAAYTAATNTQPAKVRVVMVNANGFTTGEFCTVNGDIGAGHSPKAADFSLESFFACDTGGNILSGLTAGFTVDIQ